MTPEKSIVRGGGMLDRMYLCNGQGGAEDTPLNPLIATLKPQSNGPSYSNTVIGTLAVDGWAVIFGTARRRLGGQRLRPVPSLLYKM